MILHLDLEGTVIISYHDPFLINIEKVKEFIKKHNIEEIHIFSHALYDKEELNYYHTNIHPYLEQSLDVHICKIPTVKEIMKVVGEVDKNVPSTVAQYLYSYEKKESFFSYCKGFDKTANHILIDDCVGCDLQVIRQEPASFIETIPIGNIEDWEPINLSGIAYKKEVAKKKYKK